MRAIAAKDAKNNFGEMLHTVKREPLTIEKHGWAVAVVMSVQKYQRMKLEAALDFSLMTSLEIYLLVQER